MRILYDSKNIIHKSPFGCLKKGEKCSMYIHIPCDCEAESVSVCLETDEGTYRKFEFEKTDTKYQYDIFSSSFEIDECGLYFYFFEINARRSSFKLFKYGESDTNIEEGERWQLSCIPDDFTTPDSFKGRVMYQIFPDRFCQYGDCDLTGKLEPYYVHQNKSEQPFYQSNDKGEILNNDFYGGNLRGITHKLDYLEELGVEIIYLNPIFYAYSNHRYDTCDYKKIDPMLGTEDDFRTLCVEAHKRSMLVLLDGVFSHTGCDSIYFDKYNRFGTGVYHNPNSDYRDWYNFEHYPDKYDTWWGIETLPCTNEMCDSYIKYIITDNDSVVRHWIRAGADGFRLDVADELPDEFIKLLRDTVKQENPEAMVLGEVWEDASNKTAYSIRRKYFSDAELDSVMNYPFRNAIVALSKNEMSVEKFRSEIMTIVENYPHEVLHCLMNMLSTHDTERILTNLTGADMNLSRGDKAKYIFSDGERELAKSRLKIAVMLQFFLPGNPCIYYGDEIGMEGFGDPFNRGFFEWNNTQNEISDLYKTMAKIKSTVPALRDGNIQFVKAESGILIMKRSCESGHITAVVNVSGNTVKTHAVSYLATHNCTCLDNSVYVQKGGFALY